MATPLEYILKLNKGDFSKGMEDAEKATERLDEGFSKLKETILGIAGITLGAEFLKGAAESFIDMEKTAAQLKFTVGARGGVGDSFKELTEQAEGLGKTSFFNHVEIEKGQKELLEYGISIDNVKNSMGTLTDAGLAKGKELTEVVGDIARASSTGMLRGIRPYGLEFTKLEQRILKTGNEAARFQVIVNEMKNKFTDAANEMKGAEFFQIKKLQDQFEEFKEKLGKDLLKLFDLLRPKIEMIINKLVDLIHWAEINKDTLMLFAKTLAELFIGYEVAKAIGAIQTAIMALGSSLATNPLGILLTTLGAVLLLYNQIADAREKFEQQGIDDMTNISNKLAETYKKGIEDLGPTAGIKLMTDQVKELKTNLDDLEAQAKSLPTSLGTDATKDFHDRLNIARARFKVADDAESKVLRDALTGAPGKRGATGSPAAPSTTEEHHEKIVINITKLVETLAVHAVTLKEGSAEIKNIIAETLMEAINSVKQIHN